jgi:hypothetical protein
LKAEQKQWSIPIRGNSSYSPIFGQDEIVVCDNCSAGNANWTWFDTCAYTNGTGLNGRTFFTGKEHFTVKEIEVFKITIESTLHTIAACACHHEKRKIVA